MSFGVFMNKDSYEGLSEDQRKVVDEVSDAFIDHMAEVMIGELEADRAEMVAGIDGKSIEIARFSEADRQKVLEAGRRQVEAWAEEAEAAGLDAAALLADYEARIEQYAKELADKGYPWTR
jgi:TRAP-type C4-dicarboxylate transport system substrate-binding protein